MRKKTKDIRYAIGRLKKKSDDPIRKIVNTICPRSSYPFYIVSYYIKWVTTSWTHSTGSATNFTDISLLFCLFLWDKYISLSEHNLTNWEGVNKDYTAPLSCCILALRLQYCQSFVSFNGHMYLPTNYFPNKQGQSIHRSEAIDK